MNTLLETVEATVTEFTWFTQFAQFTRFLRLTWFSGVTPLKLRKLCKLGKLAKLCKLFVFCSLLSALLFCLPFPLQAKVTGACSHCHTMHSSQTAAPTEWTEKGWTAGTTNPALLVATCIGCHSTTNGSTWKRSGAPIVFNSDEPTYGNKGLAGGNFYYVSKTVDNTGHNVLLTNPDDTLGNTPPGGTTLTNQLRCAGTWGCHGHNGRQAGDTPIDDQTKAIRGGHHGDDTPPLEGSLTNAARNYRFLLGIKGKEDTDWEQGNTNTSHNEYKGSTSSATDTISYLCAECHGKFHTWVGGASEVYTTTAKSPWLRHPTDALLKNSGEYANYTTYSMAAPVARPDPNNVSDTTKVYPGTDIIMCLSCHRSHASPYFKMMRWDYKAWPGAGADGCDPAAGEHGCCNVCHTWKN